MQLYVRTNLAVLGVCGYKKPLFYVRSIKNAQHLRV